MRVLFDPSALFKRYNRESGRDQVLAAGDRASEVMVAAHCKSEIASALNRNRHDGLLNGSDYGDIMRAIQRDFADFTLVALTAQVEAHAISAMEISRLRAMDALHIGSAQAARVDLFVTADRRQALAAQAVGLKTELIDA